MMWSEWTGQVTFANRIAPTLSILKGTVNAQNIASVVFLTLFLLSFFFFNPFPEVSKTPWDAIRAVNKTTAKTLPLCHSQKCDRTKTFSPKTNREGFRGALPANRCQCLPLTLSSEKEKVPTSASQRTHKQPQFSWQWWHSRSSALEDSQCYVTCQL